MKQIYVKYSQLNSSHTVANTLLVQTPFLCKKQCYSFIICGRLLSKRSNTVFEVNTMAIDFNRPNSTAGLSKPITQNVRQNPTQTRSTDANKQVNVEQSSQQARTGEPVELSQNARQLQSLSDKIAEQPSVNSEKVAQLKQAIAESTYKVDSERVASKILDLEAQF